MLSLSPTPSVAVSSSSSPDPLFVRLWYPRPELSSRGVGTGETSCLWYRVLRRLPAGLYPCLCLSPTSRPASHRTQTGAQHNTACDLPPNHETLAGWCSRLPALYRNNSTTQQLMSLQGLGAIVGVHTEDECTAVQESSNQVARGVNPQWCASALFLLGNRTYLPDPASSRTEA